ncbi:hypothetical protein AXF14_12280 [Actinomyces radicidentis]|uniref:MFS transporter n=1 Tax=Actinomyces radicidentis TaxID=111015 RepID=A0A0X8JG60_ACTRD|nr:MFS transporter [Actinomyces radicidentis]AMD88215.1 hypothetical protein AXF14_12280 [Actinomyces radicidentis]
MATRALWRDRDYLAWLVGDTAGALTGAMRLFAIPLIAYATTGSAALAGGATGLTAIVAAMLSILGGVLADTHDRRALMRWYAVTGALVHGGFGVLVLLGAVSSWWVMVYAVASGVRAGLLGDVTNIVLKSVVSDANLTEAFGANQARDQVVLLASGPLAGVLFAVSPALPFLAELGASLVLLLALAGIQADLGPHEAPSREELHPLTALREGVTWVLRHRVVRRLLAVSVPLSAGMAGVASAVIIHLQARGTPAPVIGLVGTAEGAGALCGALVATAVARRVPSGWAMILGASLTCVAYLPMLVLTQDAVVVAAMGAAAACTAVTNAVFGSYFMHVVPDALLGRALSVSSLAGAGAGGLGSAMAGALLGAVGFRLTLIVLVLLSALAVPLLLTAPALRAVPRPDQWEPAGA